MKSKKLLSILCLLALTGCDVTPTSSTTSSSKQATSSSTTTTSSTSSSTSSLSSSSSTPQTYGITLSKNDGGDATLSKSTAAAGETITITLSYDEGYKLGSIDSEQVTLTEASETTYTFTMPESAVTINIEFIESTAEFLGFKNYTSTDTLKFTSLSIGDEFEIGTTETFELTITSTSSDSNFISDRLFYVNDVIYSLTQDETDPSKYSFEYTITEDFDIFYAKRNEIAKEDIEEGIETGILIDYSNTENYTIIGIEKGAKYNATIEFAIATKPGYKVEEVYYTEEGYPEDEYSLTRNISTGLYRITTSSLENNITIHVETTTANIYNITYTGTDNLDLANSELPATATYDEFISFKFTTKDGYTFHKASFTSTDENATLRDKTQTSFKLAMPNSDLTVALTITQDGEFEVIANPNIESYKISSSNRFDDELTSFTRTANIYLTATAKEGYIINGITATAIETGEPISTTSNTNSSGITYYQLRSNNLPLSGNIKIEFDTKQDTRKTVTLDTSVEYTFIEFIDDDSATSLKYNPGDTVNFSAGLAGEEIPENYEIIGFECSDPSVEITGGADNNYSFIMPDGDITITPKVGVSSQKRTVTLKALPQNTMVYVTGLESDEFLNAEGTSDKFLKNEDFTIEFYNLMPGSDFNYLLKLTIDGVEQQPISLTDYFTREFTGDEGASFSCSNLIIEIIEIKAIDATLVNEDDVNVSFYIDGDSINLNTYTFQENQKMAIEINEEPQSGTTYTIKVTDTNTGDELPLDNTNAFVIKDDFTITITKETSEVSYALYEFKNESSQTDSGLKYSFNYTDYSEMDEGKFEVGKQVKFQLSLAAPITIIVEIYVGDELVATLDRSASRNATITIEDTTKVTVIAKDKA